MFVVERQGVTVVNCTDFGVRQHKSFHPHLSMTLIKQATVSHGNQNSGVNNRISAVRLFWKLNKSCPPENKFPVNNALNCYASFAAGAPKLLSFRKFGEPWLRQDLTGIFWFSTVTTLLALKRRCQFAHVVRLPAQRHPLPNSWTW